MIFDFQNKLWNELICQEKLFRQRQTSHDTSGLFLINYNKQPINVDRNRNYSHNKMISFAHISNRKCYGPKQTKCAKPAPMGTNNLSFIFVSFIQSYVKINIQSISHKNLTILEGNQKIQKLHKLKSISFTWLDWSVHCCLWLVILLNGFNFWYLIYLKNCFFFFVFEYFVWL